MVSIAEELHKKCRRLRELDNAILNLEQSGALTSLYETFSKVYDALPNPESSLASIQLLNSNLIDSSFKKQKPKHSPRNSLTMETVSSKPSGSLVELHNNQIETFKSKNRLPKAYSFSRDKKLKDKFSLVPGPGSYTPKYRDQSPTYKMTKSTRPDNFTMQQNSPGCIYTPTYSYSSK